MNPNNSIVTSLFLRILFSSYIIFCFFEPYLNTIIGNIGRYYIFIVIIFFALSYNTVKIKWFHTGIILWFSLKITSIFWVSFNQIVQQHFISQIGMVALFIVMTIVCFDSEFIDTIINSLLYSSSILGVLCLFFSKPFIGVATRQVLTIRGAQMDPNNQAAFLVVAITISLYYFMNRKCKAGYYFVLTGIILVNIYAMFLTGSRGGLVSLILIILILALLSEKSSKLVSKHTFINFVVIALILTIAFFLAKAYLPERIFERLFNIYGYEGGSERINIWGNAARIFLANPLFGGGWGSYWGYNGYYSAVHNTFISIIVDGGIIGFILFFIPVIYIILNSLKQHYILPILLLVTGFAPSFFIDAINKRFFWNAIIISMILVLNKTNQARVCS